MLERYLYFIQKHSLGVIALCLLVVALISAGLPRLSITNDFRIYFGENNPQLQAFETLEETYGRQDTLYIFIEPLQGDIFHKPVIELIWHLTKHSWDLPYVNRVNSLTNYQHTEAKGDTLLTDYLVPDPDKLNETTIARIRNIVMYEPALVNNLSSRDALSTGIRMELDLPRDKAKATDESVAAAQKLIQHWQQQYPGIKISLSGSAAAGVSLGQAVERDLETLVTWSYIVIVLGLLVLLRSLRGMLMTIILVTLSVLATMGTYGWFDFVLTPVAGWVPSIVMTIAVADSVHILTTYFHGLRNGMPREEAVRNSLRINARPVLITSITTIIGVLCLNFSDSPPYQDLGNMVALGVLFAYILTTTFLPAVLFWLNLGKQYHDKGSNRFIDSISQLIFKTRYFMLIGMSLVFAFLSSHINNNELTERWHEYFDESFPLRVTTEAINKKLTGVHYIRYVLETGQEGGIHEPDYLNKIEAFSNWFRQQNGVAYVSSLTNISKRLNKTLHEDKTEWYRIPDSRELASQLFLLYEIGLPRELNLDNMVDLDRSASLVTVVIHKTDSEFLLELDHKAQQWLKQHAKDIQFSEGTGLDMVFAHINHRNIRSLLEGTFLALILISFLLVFALRSIKLGLLSLIPNLMPAAMAYGAWGLLVGRVDMSASVVICMSLGIVVDDTVHFLSKYLYARRDQGLDVTASLDYAFQTVGMALITTTSVLVAGFLVLAASPFSPTWVSGLLMAITLSFALLADFFFLPPLLMVLNRVKQFSRQAS